MEQPSLTSVAGREQHERGRLLKSRFLIALGCTWLLLDLVLQAVSLLPCPGSYLSEVSLETFLLHDLAARIAQIPAGAVVDMLLNPLVALLLAASTLSPWLIYVGLTTPLERWLFGVALAIQLPFALFGAGELEMLLSVRATECRHFVEGAFWFMGFTCGAFSTATFLTWHVVVGQHRAADGAQR